MSGSPKYASPSLSDQATARLAALRAQREQERARRRAQREAARQAARQNALRPAPPQARRTLPVSPQARPARPQPRQAPTHARPAVPRTDGAIEAAGDAVALLRDDPVVARWHAPAVEALEGRIELARARHGTGDEATAAEIAEAVQSDAASLVAHAERIQQREDRRALISDALRSVMAEMGFGEVEGSGRLERDGDPTSARILHFRSLSRREAGVAVPLDGSDLEIEVEGFGTTVEVGADGNPVATCDEAEEQLREAFERMAVHGVHMGQLRWDGQGPRGAARDRARTQPRARTR